MKRDKKEKSKKKRMYPEVKGIIAVLLCGAILYGGLFFGIQFVPSQGNQIDLGYGSVSYEVEEGETFSPEKFVPRSSGSASEDTYDEIDVFGRLNWTFAQAENWSGEMHGIVKTPVDDQNVQTYKQYADGMLISYDITTSGLVNVARQYCYVGDRVIWRDADPGTKKDWNGIDTVFPDKAPQGNMLIDGENGFRATRGLPATELSVYVFTEDTVLDGDIRPVSALASNGDGTFTLTYHMDPTLTQMEDGTVVGAAAYYANQMIATGGLSGTPAFEHITVSYTFDENWRVLACEIDEAYTAKMGIEAHCTSTSRTEYHYDVPELEESVRTVYESYFEQYAASAATGVQKSIDALTCLATGLGGILDQPTVLSLQGDVDGAAADGFAYVDLNLDISDLSKFDLSAMEARLRLGNLSLQLADGLAYLNYGGMKLSLSVEDLLPLFTGAAPAAQAEEEEDSDILSELTGGEFTYDESSARLRSSIHVAGQEIGLDLSFTLDSEMNVTFAGGSVSLSLQGNAITLDVAFADPSKAPAALTAAEKETYADLTSAALDLYEIFTSPAIHLTADYPIADPAVTLHAEADLSLSGMQAAGTLTALYGEQEKHVSFGYSEGKVYLALEGIRLKADVQEAADLIAAYFAPAPAPAAETDPSGEISLKQVIETLFSEEFAAYFTSWKEEDAVGLLIKGSEVLQAFGAEFALGDVRISFEEKKLSVSVLGAGLTLAKGEAVTVDTKDYIDILPYAEHVLTLVNSRYLKADLRYTSTDLTVEGSFAAELALPALSGSATVNYKGLTKELSLIYAGEELCLTLDEWKVKADPAQAVSLIASALGADMGSADFDVLSALFGFDFSHVNVQAQDTLQVAVAGTELLKAFGITFDLGPVELSLGEDGLTASALGITLTLQTGESAPQTDTAGYTDFTPAVEKLAAIIGAKALAFDGELQLDIKGIQAGIALHSGALSWEDGSVYLDATLVVGDSANDLILYADGERVKILYGELGLELIFADFTKLEEAWQALTDRIRTELVDPATSTQSPDEEGGAEGGAEGGDAVALTGLLDVAKAGLAAAQAGKEFDWTLLNDLVLTNSALENGLLALVFDDFALDFVAGDTLGAVLSYTGSFSLTGTLSADALTSFPVLPEAEWLGTEDYIELLDYFGAAAGLVAQENVRIDLSGSVLSSEEKYLSETEDSGVKYKLSGSVDYYSGGGFPFRLVEDGGVVINTTLYLGVKLSVTALHADDNSIYLELYLIDDALDGMLDFYVRVSAFGREDPRYAPLTFHAPADEIMTLLSGVFAAFGVDVDVLNNVLIDRWLDAETVLRLQALGGSLLDLAGSRLGVDIGGIMEGLNGLLGGKASAASAEERTRRGYIKSVTFGENIVLTLDGRQIYGEAYAGEDVTVTLGKTGEAGKSHLSLISLSHMANGSEETSLALSIRTGESDVDRNPDLTYRYDFDGIDTLLVALAKSATHPEVTSDTASDPISGEENVKYLLNSNFYISGSILLDASITTVNVRLVAVSISVDEEGKVGINVRLEYDGVQELNQVAINGDSQVDITIKEGMVYMKRVQTSEWTKKGLASMEETQLKTPITLYRVTTLGNFTADILDHMIFLFNFGDFIVNLIPKDGGGETEPQPPAEKKDYGATVEENIKSYLFEEGEENRWTVVVNGDVLAQGILGDLTVGLTSDKEGFVRQITAETTIVSFIKAKAVLTWRNPGGTMDTGVGDETNDVAPQLERDMAAVLASPDWTQQSYYEGEYTTVSYYAGEQLLGTQNVVRSPADGKLYTALVYPSLEGVHAPEGYTYVWNEVDSVDRNARLQAKTVANTYRLVFRSTREVKAEGWTEKDGVWEYTVENYVYGTALSLPFASDEQQRIVSFTDREGHAFTDILSKWYIFEDEIVFTADWEYIDYTVTFTVDGKTTRQTGHWGDPISFPAEHEKTGYRFTGWESDGKPIAEGAVIGGDLSVTALFTPNVYHITLVSEYAVESETFSFTLQEEGENTGKWVAEFDFTYDTKVALPGELKIETPAGKFFLDGFTYADAEGFVTEMPNVLHDTVFTAQWTAVGTDVRFRNGEDLVATRNYAVGSDLAAQSLPAVPAKQGYTGAWKIGESFLVEEREEGYDVYAEYTPIVYYFTIFSSKEVVGEGWSRHDPTDANPNLFWQMTFSYTYDGEALESIGEGVKTPGFEFDGFWSGHYDRTETGVGVVYDREWTRIDNETVAAFQYNPGNPGGTNMELTGRNILYARWRDTTVTAKLYSELAFDGAEGSDVNGYYVTIARNDADWEVGLTLSAEGHVQLGWWYCNEEGRYELVTSLGRFYTKGGENSVTLYALWVRNVTINIGKLTQTGGFVNRVNLSGDLQGGIPDEGKRSADICADAGLPAMQARYVLFSKTGGKDALNSGNLFDLTDKTFTAEGTCVGEKAYGGVEIVLSLSAGETAVQAYFIKSITFAEYKLTYEDGEGNVLHTADLHLGGNFRYTDTSAPYVIDFKPIYTRAYAEEQGLVAKEKEGYDVSWPDRLVSESLTVTPDYVVQVYEAVFISETELDGFDQADAETAYAGKWVRYANLPYGSKINFLDVAGQPLPQSFTITRPSLAEEGYQRIEIHIPAVPMVGSKTGHWEYTIGEGATFTAVYALDKVIYHSEIPFGETDASGTYTVQFTEDYQAITPTAAGYTFLGWFMQTEEGWQKAPERFTVSPEPVTYNLEALWVSDFSLTVNGSRDKSGLFTKYYVHNIAAVLSGGELVGAPKEAVTQQLDFRFTVNNNGEDMEDAPAYSKDESLSAYAGTRNYSSENEKEKTSYGWGHAKVTVTYTFNGEQLWTKTDIGHVSY